MTIRRAGALGLVVAAGSIALAVGTSGSATADEVDVLGVDGPDVVKDSYVVVLKDTATTQDNRQAAVKQTADELTAQYGGKVRFSYHAALSGFSVTASEKEARRLAADPKVQFVEANRRVTIQDTQPNPPSWGLDRIDQVDLPLDSSYTYPTTASNVNAYIIDTGIRTTHQTFGGRAVSGFDAVDGGTADDCNGHGTHVAGTVGGTEYGVAKEVNLFAVRVLDCNGSGTYEQVVAGIDWVTQNAVLPAVANMSLGGGADAALDTAVQNSIAAGVTYAVASGNSNADASGFSPARVPEAITVNASDDADARASFSNFGTITDIFAPGVDITSAWIDSDTATNTISGTSMATPHVTGAAALYLSANPEATPAQVSEALVAAAGTDKISNPGSGSPNKLLHVGDGGSTPPPPPPPGDECTTESNATRTAIPDGGAAISSTIEIAGCDSNASATTKIAVDIAHTYRGDLVIDLIAPSGAVFNLKASDIFDGADNVNTTYTIDASSEDANGTWTLRVQDVFSWDTGTLQSWSITV